MNIKACFQVILIALVLVPFAGNSAEQVSPNILFLLTDDQRSDAVGAAGNSLIHTPELDRLAAEGVRFENAFVTSSVCAPSRAAILSGLYSRTSGIRGFAETFSSEQLEQIYPVLMRKAGYRTGFIGKWGVGATVEETMAHIPDLFDSWQGFVGQGEYWPDGKEGRHLSQIMATQADRFFAEAKRGDQPFCLSVSFKAPHGPWHDADPEFKKLYRTEDMPLPPTLTEDAVAILPAFMRTFRLSLNGASIEELREIHQQFMLEYYALVSGVDHAVGKIRESLKKHGLADNTIIVFSSDNGHFLHEFGFHGKWLMYEPSIRVPLIVYDPRLSKGKRGRCISEFALSIDLTPTFLDLAGVDVPPTMQGRSLIPLINGDAVGGWRDDAFYEFCFGMFPGDIPTSVGVRTERWKYVQYPDEHYEQLFDLKADRLETNNLAASAECRPVLEEMRKRLGNYRSDLPDRAPIWNEYLEQYATVTTGSRWPDKLVDFNEHPKVAQSFMARGSVLKQVNWKVPYQQQGISPVDLKVCLYRGNELLGETTIPAANLYSLYPVEAVFDVAVISGETYRLEFIPAGEVALDRLKLWAFPENTFPDGSLSLDGKSCDSDLSLEFVYLKE